MKKSGQNLRLNYERRICNGPFSLFKPFMFRSFFIPFERLLYNPQQTNEGKRFGRRVNPENYHLWPD